MIGADLARLPARDRDVALANLAENLLDVAPGIPLLLLEQIEDMHGAHLRPRPARYASPSTIRKSRSAALLNTFNAA